MTAVPPIQLIYRSQTSGHVPSSLPYGQLAANVPDLKFWIGNTSNLPVLLSQPAVATSAVSATGNIVPTAATYVVLVTTGSTVGMVLNLPAASSSANQVVICKKVDASTGSIALTGSGTDTIDGYNVQTIGPTQYDVLAVVCDGTQWNVFNFG